MSITGGCRCGAVRYTLTLDALPPTYACHCHQCQRWSGSAFSQQAMIPEAAIVAEGPITIYERTTEDRTSRQRVCNVCHSRIYNTNTRRPGMAVVRAGTLDASEQLDCVANIWVRHKQPWVILAADVPTWPETPAPDAIASLLQANAR